MSKGEIQYLLEEILDALLKILSHTAGINKEDFLKNKHTIDAVLRNFEMISESAGRIPEEFKILRRDIEWRRMTGFHNRIHQNHSGIDYEIVWKIKEENIPDLVEFIRQAMDDLKKLPGTSFP
ncbi:MAG TPA: HepT-like ribonuclease domain-containing protein [Chitinophagaceae bacterium]|nr:HepT-like ribonuclease domain-containing protein [Chitinophagaceae bacterium]